MANGADIVMSDQSSCLPSQQHISHSYRFSPLAQAEDLDAYLMFIFYRSRLSRPVRTAKSLKRWQSPCEASAQPDGIKQARHGGPRSDTPLPDEEAANSASVTAISRQYLTINAKAWKGDFHQLNTTKKHVTGDERELMHIMSERKRRRRITATLWDWQRGGELLRVSAFKYLNHAPVTPFPHVDVSVYQNEGWQKTSVLVCVQTACVDSLMEPTTLMHFLP